MSVVTASTETTKAAFVVAEPPTGEDLNRWALLAAQPGLVGATWTGAPGSSSR